MNENLRHALLRAQLSEEDIATRLQVDPKTVRRWLEGRVPYLRHRWTLAGILGLNEADLWPDVSAARPRTEEVRGIYPHRETVPRDVWLSLFSSAVRHISLLDHSALFLAQDVGVLAILANRAQAKVSVQICLRDPESDSHAQGSGDAAVGCVRLALVQYASLQDRGPVEIRLHRLALSNSIYRADEELMVVQHAYGISAERASVLHLRRADSGDMVNTYIESFKQVWARALSA